MTRMETTHCGENGHEDGDEKVDNEAIAWQTNLLVIHLGSPNANGSDARHLQSNLHQLRAPWR